VIRQEIGVAQAELAGLLNLNKPAGMTSRQAVDIVSRLAATGRVGHAGTLDPLAQGVLVLCLGWTTRLVSCIQEQRKVYHAEFLLGRTSDTDDTTGTVLERAVPMPPERGAIEAALRPFVGRVLQVPPRHSAVHVAGRRAYHLARQGLPVELAPRAVDIFRLELIACEYPRLVLDIECGSGTYVRAIGRDLGEILGCGAVMSNLERRAIGAFHIESSVSPEDLTTGNLHDFLLPPLAAVSHRPQYRCSPAELALIRNGRPIAVESLESGQEPAFVAVVDPAGRLAALAEYQNDHKLLRPRQVFTEACDA
jgi:tRNA pseudouridine55 synthase